MKKGLGKKRVVDGFINVLHYVLRIYYACGGGGQSYSNSTDWYSFQMLCLAYLFEIIINFMAMKVHFNPI